MAPLLPCPLPVALSLTLRTCSPPPPSPPPSLPASPSWTAPLSGLPRPASTRSPLTRARERGKNGREGKERGNQRERGVFFCLATFTDSRQPKGSSCFTAPLVLLFSHSVPFLFSLSSPLFLPTFLSSYVFPSSTNTLAFFIYLFFAFSVLLFPFAFSVSFSFSFSECSFHLLYVSTPLSALLRLLVFFSPFLFFSVSASSLLFFAFLRFSPFLLSLSSPSLSLPLLSSPNSLFSQTSACTRGPTTARPSTPSRSSALTPPTSMRVAASPSSAPQPTLAPLLH